jgi:chromate reductase, NAD(P)H dehydrogenase (quinone)
MPHHDQLSLELLRGLQDLVGRVADRRESCRRDPRAFRGRRVQRIADGPTASLLNGHRSTGSRRLQGSRRTSASTRSFSGRAKSRWNSHSGSPGRLSRAFAIAKHPLVVVGSRRRRLGPSVSSGVVQRPRLGSKVPTTPTPGEIATVDGQAREPVSFLVFSASLREGSLNTRLAELAASVIESNGGTVDFGSMADFDCPAYNADAQRERAFPAGADELRRRLEASDAFVICSPEYNASMPGALKNAVDWVSRFRPQPFNERHGLLVSASPSMVGGNRGLWALRIPFEHLGARLYPDMFSLAQAHKAFDADGRIANEQLHERFETNVANFMDLVEASKHYPCIKRAWVEYLGEQPDPVLDRVEPMVGPRGANLASGSGP